MAASLIITILILLIPVFDSMAVDPRVQLIVSFLFLFLLALIMLRLVLPRRAAALLVTAPQRAETAEGGVESTERLLGDALEGSDYSKYLALKQLRDIAVSRIMLRLHLGREEAESLIGDERWLRHVLKDDTLARVVAHDYHGTPHGTREKMLLGDVFESFDVKFPELLSRVEDLR